MTREELEDELLGIMSDVYRAPYPKLIDRLFIAFHKAGWKSPEEWKIAENLINHQAQELDEIYEKNKEGQPMDLPLVSP
jgi:hypothetical protein